MTDRGPTSLPAYTDLLARANQALQSNDLDGAEAMARSVLAGTPAVGHALNLIGLSAIRQGQVQRAMDTFLAAVTACPSIPHPLLSAAEVFQQQGKFDDALQTLDRATQVDESFAPAWFAKGLCLLKLQRPAEAEGAFRHALSRGIQNPIAHVALSDALTAMGRGDEARLLLEETTQAYPQCAEAWNNLGVLYEKQDQSTPALAAFDRATSLQPQAANFRLNRALALGNQLRLDASRAEWERVLQLSPENAEAWVSLAILNLLAGQLERGWDVYEQRWRLPAFRKLPLAGEEWTGQPLQGKRIVLYPEAQGMGDSIQFARYVSLLADRGAYVILLTNAPLIRLFQTIPGIAEVIEARPQPPWPVADYHLPLLSLPKVFGTSLGSVPRSVPYLSATAGDIARWRRRIPTSGAMKVGIAWRGSALHRDDQKRSIALALLSPLWDVGGVEFVSLQKGPARQEIASSGLRIQDVGEELTDFADTAGAMANLDLVISVDTSIVHLGGALGRPVWNLITYHPDWRWLLNRNDSPWYPTMQLFRQPQRADWAAVIEEVKSALAGITKAYR